MILAMENAGQLIEDEELREQIRSTGIGTSATRAEILKKLVNNRYIALSSKTQILTPTLLAGLCSRREGYPRAVHRDDGWVCVEVDKLCQKCSQ